MGLSTHMYDADPKTHPVRTHPALSPLPRPGAWMRVGQPRSDVSALLPPQMLMHYGENYVRHKFDDPTLLAKWSQHKPYRCVHPGVVSAV